MQLLPGISATRNEHGIFEIAATDDRGLYFGLGYAHAHDRALQMLLVRILGQGRAAEFLDGSDEMVKIDRFFRRMNWHADGPAQLAQLSARSRELLAAYVDGVNRALGENLPWELRLAGYRRHEPWCAEDCLLLARVIGYVNLAQTQADIERLFIEMVQAGVDRARLDELFPGLLEGVDLELIEKVRLGERTVPHELVWKAVPRMTASNNWAVSGAHTRSGRAMLCSDPHLEVSRIPALFYEVVLRQPPRYGVFATMPGLPALVVGRTNEVAWGPTYSYMDACDSWIEHCKEGRYRRGDNDWRPFTVRRERIIRKGAAPVEAVYHENEHGVLDGDPGLEGYYLTSRWSAGTSGARSLEANFELWHARSTAQALAALGRFETAWNWVAADQEGNIGYQMSGLLPTRAEGVTGFAPQPGWDPRFDWQGFARVEELPRFMNPPSGIVVTANNNLNAHGRVPAITMCSGEARAERIATWLGERNDLTAEDMFALQYDTYSPQARAYLKILKPLLPTTPAGQALASWDCCYRTDAREPGWFEDFYRALVHEVLDPNLGTAVTSFLLDDSEIFAGYFPFFDEIFCRSHSAWFAGRSREAIFRAALDRALGNPATQTWGERQTAPLAHILFGGKLPAFLGFDRGPIQIPGGRATVHQGQLFRMAGRDTSFAPAYRMVADFGEDGVHTNLPGGVSDRRFSRLYCNDLANWVAGRYKKLPA